MLSWFIKKVFGSKNQRELNKLWPIVHQINQKCDEYEALPDAELQAHTDTFKERVRNGEALDDLLVEAFATVKSACKRLLGQETEVTGLRKTWDMVPYDVQLLGAIVLYRGMIAEMQTGEGKTLVAILPLYLNALTGCNCQLVTVNDYLARRDAQWVGFVLRWLGITVGCIQNDMAPEERREQYLCDITYGTNSEFGFDYLRDMGMATDPEELVQRDYYYAIVDEVDSILIDEARTPLIISGPVDVSTHKYDKLKPRIAELYKKQYGLCNRLANEAKDVLTSTDGKDIADTDAAEAVIKMFLVKLGMPKHRQFMRMMQEPEIRRLVERKEAEARSDQNRGMLQELKDRLYFHIDERANDADLSELGRQTLSPKDPESFVLPDLATGFHRIDEDPEFSDEQKRQERERLQTLFDERSESIHNIAQLLKAYCLYEKDVHYIIEDGKVIIVDEHTGRPMYGRRFSEGLHMALEAKEGVEIERETRTLASVTIQNYFRMYEKLAGMTGTAATEANEFKDIYNLEVLEVPTNEPCIRSDYHDLIYKTKRDKYKAIIDEVRGCHQHGQPVLLGTISVEVSEILGKMLKRERIPHSVLNAKHHQAEAEIIVQAGQSGAVTIATNMAGRGTDIVLGEGVPDAGGLHVLASERHDARRIDRQLRGRGARQGDAGSSRFYISLEDDLMRIFGGDRITKLLERFGFEDGEEISGGLLSRTIQSAQRRVEQEHYSYRKHTLQYDNVMNEQRAFIYGHRRECLKGEEPREILMDHIFSAISGRLALNARDTREHGYPFDRQELLRWLQLTFAPVGFSDADLEVDPQAYDPEEVANKLTKRVGELYEHLAEGQDPEFLWWLERQIILNAHDSLWQEHLDEMDYLRQAIRLHAYAQRDPLVEYKKEAFTMFDELVARIDEEIAGSLFSSTQRIIGRHKQLLAVHEREITRHQVLGQFERGAAATAAAPAAAPVQLVGPDGEVMEVMPEDFKIEPFRKAQPKVGRNEPCPCGSGKKYKKCCGRREL